MLRTLRTLRTLRSSLRRPTSGASFSTSGLRARGASAGPLDLLVKNASAVLPDEDGPIDLDIGIKDGKFSVLAAAGSVNEDKAADVFDAKGLMAFPGVIDAHTHIAGIYQDIELDMNQESKCAAQGGVTTVMPYIRSGLCYLNEGGSYYDLYHKFLRHAENNYHCDYAYHVSPSKESTSRKWSGS